MNKTIKRIMGVTATLALSLGLVALVSGPSIAHDTGISGKATCIVADGSAKIQWTVTNDYGTVETISASDNSSIPVGSTIPAAVNGVNGSVTFTQTVPAPAGGVTVNATITGHWPDNFTQVKSAAPVKVSTDCVVPHHKDATADVAATTPSCTTAGTASVIGLNHASLVGVLDTSIGTHTATFQADANFYFADDTQTKTVTYTVAGKDLSKCAGVSQCSAQHAPTAITTLAAFDAAAGDTRSGGSHALVSGGLHIKTFGSNLGQAKDAQYIDVNIPIEQAGTPALGYTPISGASAGLNLTVFVDGVWKGNLVLEPLYPKYWSTFAVTDIPQGPNSYQKGYGSLDDFARAFESNGHVAVIRAVGYSLGSGAIGEGLVTSLTVGCDQYVFGLPPAPAARLYDVPSNTDTVCNPDGSGGGSYIHSVEHHSVSYKWDEASQQYVEDQDTVTGTDHTPVNVGTDVCPVIVTTDPVFPTQIDKCGTENDVRQPAVNTDAYTIETVTNKDGSADYTATANEGYQFGPDVKTTGHLDALDNTACIIPGIPVTTKQLAQTGVPVAGGLALAALAIMAGFGIVILRRRKTA